MKEKRERYFLAWGWFDQWLGQALGKSLGKSLSVTVLGQKMVHQQVQQVLHPLHSVLNPTETSLYCLVGGFVFRWLRSILLGGCWKCICWFLPCFQCCPICRGCCGGVSRASSSLSKGMGLGSPSFFHMNGPPVAFILIRTMVVLSSPVGEWWLEKKILKKKRWKQ